MSKIGVQQITVPSHPLYVNNFLSTPAPPSPPGHQLSYAGTRTLTAAACTMDGNDVELSIQIRSSRMRLLLRLPSDPTALFSMALAEPPTIDLLVCSRR